MAGAATLGTGCTQLNHCICIQYRHLQLIVEQGCKVRQKEEGGGGN